MKEDWRAATFGSEGEFAEDRDRFGGVVQEVLENFGVELIKLAEPIWSIQSAALGKASWAQ
jgi:hypothetical protein